MGENEIVETAQIEEAQNNLNFEKELEKEAKRKCCAFCDSEVSVLEICEDCLMRQITELTDDDFYDFGESEEKPCDKNCENCECENGGN